MLNLVTGTPGAGKTLYTISSLADVEDRPIFYHGITDLNLPWHAINDPEFWHKEVPDGAIVVIDEVQKIFPVRDHKKPVPDGIAAIETHRHRGIDIYFITQHPSLVDHHARRLVGSHIHVRRTYGAQLATLFKLGEAFDPKDKLELKRCEASSWTYPKKAYDYYKSAEIHTVKRSFPKKLLFIPLCLALVVGCFWLAMATLFGDDDVVATVQSPENPSYASAFDQPIGSPKKKVITAEDFIPTIPDVPASAPIYAEAWEVKSVPKPVACIASETRCICYSQQSTLLRITEKGCRNYAARGFFDHMKEDDPKVPRARAQAELPGAHPQDTKPRSNRIDLSDVTYSNPGAFTPQKVLR